MEENALVRLRDRTRGFLSVPYVRRTALLLLGAMAGLLSARGLVFGKYAPFAAAAAAAAPFSVMWSVIAGASLGYLIPSPVDVPARYIAALLAVGAIRWSLSELKTVRDHPVFVPAVAFLPLLATGVTTVLISGSLSNVAAMVVAESFLAGGTAYFLRRTVRLLESRREAAVFDSGDVAAVIVTLGVLLLSFSGITVAGVSIGRILIVLTILVSARLGGLSGGAVAGIAAGTVQGLSTAGLSYLSGAYGLGGLMAGVFSPLGKIAVAIAFVISNGIATLQVNGSVQAFYGAVEVAIASIVYMLLPQSRRLTTLFAVRRDKLPGDSLRKNVILRLRYAADAMRGASESVDKISKQLQDTAADDLPGVYGRAAEKICAGCSQCAVCWRKNRDETQKSFSRLGYPLRENGRVERSDFDVPFLTRCGRAAELRDAVNGEYRELLAKESAKMRAEQVRAVVEEHFRSTSQMLGDMAEEFEQYQHFDEDSAEQVREVLRRHELTPIEVCCRIDKFGRMTIEANVHRPRGLHINKGQLTREISSACGRTFSQPSVAAAGDILKLQMCQKPVYAVQRGFAQHAANGAALCGDCAAAFTDGSGRYFAVLSDGMGTGGRAAVDGTMTASMAQSLLKAGIGFESTLRMINSAMLAKGGEESLATLDVVCIDLFTGQTQLRKAGAAGTVLRRKHRAEYLEAKSVPVGIMPEVRFARSEKALDSGDLIVMVSDGVTAAGTEWLCDLVGNFAEDDAQALAEQIVDRAVKDRADGHEDDVSAVVLLVE